MQHSLNTHILKGSGTLNWAYFTTYGNEVEVVALTGFASYIDRRMPVAEARDQYKRLREAGWQVWENHQTAMTKDELQFWIYD